MNSKNSNNKTEITFESDETKALTVKQSEIRINGGFNPNDNGMRRKMLDRLQLLEAIVLSVNDVILITEAEPFRGPDGPKILYVNEAFQRMTGYTSKEVVGKTPRILQGPKTDKKQLDIIRAALEKWEPARVELINYKKDGTEFAVELSITPICNEEGFYTHWVSVQRDTSERKRIENDLYQAHEQLRFANDQLEVKVRQRTAELLSANIELKKEIAERKRVEKQLYHDAFHDPLTDLPNRALFTDHLKLSFKRLKTDKQSEFAVLFIDLDRFKIVNDSLGHMVGDQLLIAIAQRLRKNLRPNDVLARLGGDEFMILIEELKHPMDALRVAEHILKNLEESFELAGHELFCSASIGISTSATGYSLPEAMMRDADIAMYRAKAAGKSRYEVFDKTMHTQGLERLKIENELRHALERDEFILYYQPIISLDESHIAGFEALIRWNHPERGIVSPGEFISIAEETGLIVPIGQWVLRESCRQQQIWETNRRLYYPFMKPFMMSVNLSLRQFTQPDLAEQVQAALNESGLAAKFLKLEITESHVMENAESAVTTMRQLHALGIELSLDDFGTGYSSLDHLHRLPVSYLKIDRSFVSRMGANDENCEIVRTIITLAHNLKMQVIAEGIETEEQLSQIKRLGGKYAQGFYFAKPQTALGIEQYIMNAIQADFPQNLDVQISQFDRMM